MSDPLAYFITFSCYGTWLPGDERGSVDKEHNRYGDPFLAPDVAQNAKARQARKDPPYNLDQPRREIALQAIICKSSQNNWCLLAVHVRSNHIHIVVQAKAGVDRVMNDFKAAASRRLNTAYPEERERRRWTRHGSTRYLWTDDAIAEKVDYTLNQQGAPMQRWPEHQSKSSESS